MANSIAKTSATPLPWPDKESEYQLKEMIGVGSVAHVYRAHCIPRKEKCAIKIFDMSKFKTTAQTLLQQVQLMSNYTHTNLVSYYASFIVNNDLWLVMNLLEGGSLRDIINYKLAMVNCKHGVFDEITIATVLKSVLEGLEYLNKNGQAHRNIKAGNILIGDDGSIKMTDFGIINCLTFGRGISRWDECGDFVGSPCWMAPEVMNPDEKYDLKADIWSVGITAIELATGNPPYYKYSPMKVVNVTLRYDPPNLDTGAEEKHQYDNYGKTFRKFITVCLYKDPARRPTPSRLLQHPFLQRAKDNKLIAQTVVSVGPSYDTRVQKLQKSREPQTIRLHRTSSGEWEWTIRPEEAVQPLDAIVSAPADADSTTEEPKRGRLSGMKSALANFFKTRRNSHSSSSDSEDDDYSYPMVTPHEVETSFTKMRPGPQVVTAEVHKVESKASTSAAHDMKATVVPIVFRYRRDGKLGDVKFTFSRTTDGPEGVAEDLVRGGLLDPIDAVPFAHNLSRLLRNFALDPTTGPVRFHLNSTGANEVYDEDNLEGFAQLFVLNQCLTPPYLNNEYVAASV